MAENYSDLKPKDEHSYTDIELVQKSSAGVSLCGVLLSGNYEDMVQSREQVLAFPPELTLTNILYSQTQKCETFFSRVSEKRFQKGMFTLGASATISQIDMFKVQQHLDKNYVCATKYTMVPKKVLQLSHMRLSQNLICKLQAIENKVNGGSFTESIRAIFKQFGSHVLKGPVQFGGISKFSSSVEGFPDSEAKEARRCVEADLEAFYQEHCHTRNQQNVEGHDKRSMEDDLKEIYRIYQPLKDVQFGSSAVCRNMTKIGGPSQSCDFNSWQESLENYSSLWQVIDRGEEFIPIWDILREHHKHEFTNYDKVCNSLITVHKTMTSVLDVQTPASSIEESIFVDQKVTLLDIRQRLRLPTSSTIQMSDVICVNHLLNKCSEDIEEKDAAKWFLNKLIKLDHENMYAFYKTSTSKAKVDSKSNAESDSLWDDDSDEDDQENLCEGDSDELDREVESNSIHQSDILLAILLSSSLVVQQFIFTKLALCQLALPIVTACPEAQTKMFFLWASRNISRTWKTQQKNTQKDSSHEERMAVFPSHIVSFVRLGSHTSIKKSKSNILNHILYNQKHNVFLDRFCNNYKHTRKLAEGMVELAWYHPTVGDNGGPFDQTLTFLNLRGDGNEHPSALNFVLQASNIVVVLGTKKEMKVFDEKMGKCDNKRIIFLSAGTDKGHIVADKVVLGIKSDMEIKIAAKIVQEINEFLQKVNPQKDSAMSLEALREIALKCSIHVDEDDPDCAIPKRKANEVINMLEGTPIAKFKETFLPLQRKCWKNWCELDSKLHNLHVEPGQDPEQLRSRIEEEKLQCRVSQCKMQKSSFINKFYKALFQLKPSTLATYLNWVAYFLEIKTKPETMELTKKYHQLCSSDAALETIKSVDTQLTDSSLGLEHIFREITQLYSSALETECQENLEHMNILPSVIADLFIAGQPIELMDGDVAHLSLSWIQAVLEEARKKLGNPKIFVVSVLGVQSTGKSTLLNTMFGLQFAVSAGRCTRGAFMQLLRIDKELHEQLGYEYMLVVDTEGLKSSEIATVADCSEHDNRLTTFIIGIADMTIINIYGESVADIEGLLQIAVQAFIRMGKVGISPSAFFLHQNVAAVNAKDKNLKARKELEQRLDRMTCIAAEGESTTGEHNRFRDVINFTDESVDYISGLLKGDPPMAPPNPGYSMKVHKVQQRLMSIQCGNKRMDAFIPRLNDLWTAMQCENFVFSFRNTFEISVYKKVEAFCTKSRAQLHSTKLELEKTQCNKITNSCDLSDSLLGEINTEIEKDMRTAYNQINKNFKILFENNEDKKNLQKWKSNTENHLIALHDRLKIETKNTCKQCFENIKTFQHVDDQKQKYENRIYKSAQDLAKKLKGSDDVPDEEKLKQEFENHIWKDVYKEVSALATETYVNFAADAASVLNERYQTLNAKLQKTMSSTSFNNEECIPFVFNVQLHMLEDSVLKKFADLFLQKKNVYKRNVDQLLGILHTKMNDKLTEKLNSKIDYNQSFFNEILYDMDFELDNNFEMDLKKFKPQFTVDLILHLFSIAIKSFRELHDKFIKETSPKLYLERKKPDYYELFKDLFNGASCKIAVGLFVEHFEDAVKCAAISRVGTAIGSKLESNKPAFKDRANLEKYMLHKLAKNDLFEPFLTYIESPWNAITKYIEGEVSEWCTQNIDALIKCEYQNLEALVVKAITDTTKNKIHSGIREWINDFVENKTIKEQFNFSRRIQIIEFPDIKDIPLFTKELTSKIQEIFGMIKDVETKHEGIAFLTGCKTHPTSFLKNKLLGCRERCPFCRSLCTNTSDNHGGDHRRDFHRPTGLGRVGYKGSNILVTAFCTNEVKSDGSFYPDSSSTKLIPYSRYRDAGQPFSTWEISSHTSEQTYWKWVLCRFKDQFEEAWTSKFESIPETWPTISRDAAIKELKMP